MLPSYVLVTACMVMTVTSASVFKGNGNYQATGTGGNTAGEGYSSTGDGDSASVATGGGGWGAGSSQAVSYSTNTGGNSGQFNVKLGPSSSALGDSGFGANPSPHPFPLPAFPPNHPSPQVLGARPGDQSLLAYGQPLAADGASFLPGGHSSSSSFAHRKLTPGFGNSVGGEYPAPNSLPGGQGLPVFPQGSKNNLGSRNSGVVYEDGGSFSGGGHSGGLGSGGPLAGVPKKVGGLHVNSNSFPGQQNTDFKIDLFPGSVDDEKLYGGSNTGAFPNTLNSEINTLPSDTNLAVGGQYGNSNANQQAFNSVNNLATNAANLYTDGNQAFSNYANAHAQPLPFPRNPTVGGTYENQNSGFPGAAFPSAGNGKVQGNNAFSSSQGDGAYTSHSRSPLTVTSTNTARDDVYDSGVQSRGGSVSLNQDQINKLGDGSNLVKELLNGENVHDFNVGGGFNVNDAFKAPNSGSGNNALGRDFNSNVIKHTGNSNAGIGNSNKLGAAVLYNDGQLGQRQEDAIAKELDARAATLGFSGYSDGSDGVNAVDPRGGVRNLYSNNGGLPGNTGVPNFPGSGSTGLKPASPFNVNTNVRGGYNPSATAGGSGLPTSGGLGSGGTFGNTGRFNTPSGLGDRRTGNSMGNHYGNQNSLSGNALSGTSLGGSHLSGNSFGGSGLGSKTGGSLTNNVLGSSKSSFTQRGGSGLSNSFNSGLGERQGLSTGNADFFGKQSFTSGSRSNVLGLANDKNVGNHGLGSDFSRQGIRSGNVGYTASGFQPASSSAFEQNGLTSSSNTLHSLRKDQGLGNTALSGLNFGQNGLNSGKQFSSFGGSDGRGVGSLVSRSSSGKSSFSSSSSGAGFGSGSSLNKGGFSGRGVGVGNSLTGLSFNGGGLGQLGSTGSAVTGSSKKVYDSGVIGTSSSVSGGGNKSYSTGNGSSVSSSSSNSFDNSDYGGNGSSDSAGNSFGDSEYTGSGNSHSAGNSNSYEGNAGSGLG